MFSQPRNFVLIKIPSGFAPGIILNYFPTLRTHAKSEVHVRAAFARANFFLFLSGQELKNLSRYEESHREKEKEKREREGGREEKNKIYIHK